MNSLRKFITTGVLMMTVVSLCVVVAPSASAAASAGDLIKTSSSSSVYYLGANGKKYVFPNEATYFSWYKDFSGIVTVSAEEMDSYGPPFANITVRPGTKLIKSPSMLTVYAVQPGGKAHSIVSEANAINLYGANWAKNVIDVVDSFFTNYTVGTPLAAGVYPAGQLFKTSGSADVYVMGTDGKARKFASEAAFMANNYNMTNVVTVSGDFVMPTSGSAVNGVETGLADVSQGGGTSGGTVAGSGITVALASDTPAGGSVPTNAPVDFVKFNVTASNDGSVTVNSLKLTSNGLGTATDINDVTIYVDGARVGTTKNVDSNKEAIFNFSTGILIPAGQTRAFLARASVAGTLQYSLGIAKASDFNVSGATVSGSFPFYGNVMSGVSVTVGQLTASAGTTPSNPKLGDIAATVASMKLTNDTVEDINIYSITLKKSAGSIEDNDLENVGLYVSGVKVASSMGLKDKYVKFTFDTPYLIKKGINKNFDVKADVVDGTAKTMTISLDSTTDITAMGTIYGTYSKIAGSYPGASLTIGSGKLALAKDQPTVTKVRKDTDDVILGTIKLTPNTGIPVELRTLKITIATTTATAGSNDFENVEVLDKATGNIYDLTRVGQTSVYSNTTMDLTMNSGATKELVVRFDVLSTATNADTYAASIASVSGGDLVVYEPVDNLAVTDITPNSISFSAITVQQPALTVSTNPLSAALSKVAGESDVEVLSFNLKANSTDDLKVSELVIKDEGAGTLTSSNISSFKLYKSGVTTPVKEVSGSDMTAAEVLTFDALDINVPKGEEVKYYVTIDIDSGSPSTSTKWGITGITAEDKSKGEAVSPVTGYVSGMDSGRTVTVVAAGSLVVAMENTEANGTSRDRFEIAGNTTGHLAAIKLRAVNEAVNVSDLRVRVYNYDVVAGTSTVVNQYADKIFAKLQVLGSDKVTVLGEASGVTGTTTIEFTSDLNVPVGVTTIYVKGILNNIGKDQIGVVNQDVTLRVDTITAKGVSSDTDLTYENNAACITPTSAKVCYVTSAGTDMTLPSKAVGVIASAITSVELVRSTTGASISSSLSVGLKNVAIIKVTTDNNANTDAVGDPVKTVLSTIRVNANVIASTSAWTIEKIGGVDAAVSTSTPTFKPSTGATTVSFTTSGWTTDDELAKQSVTYYLVKANVTAVSATAGASSLEVSLNGLNSYNFVYVDGAASASAKGQLRLSTNTVNGENYAITN